MNAGATRCSRRFPAPRVAHPAFLIDRGYRLEMSLTPAISTQTPFLIVAESRCLQSRSRAIAAREIGPDSFSRSVIWPFERPFKRITRLAGKEQAS
jgi:hypothetical protein